MHTPGHPWVKNYIRPADGLGLPASAKITLLVITASLPALGGSLIAGRLSSLSTLLSVALIYLLLKPVQAQLFELSPEQRHWHVSMPIQLFMLAWALVLALVGEPEQIGRTVGALAIVVATALWPIYMSRKAYERERRTIPFDQAYGLAAAIVVIQQIFIVGNAI